ncbi:tubulin polyglutamylase ttll6-like [Mobula birostris]|uniref:tubulin polyglutamylase ttll6-like n=1 Tax=Mobula birostris TaxID=1983395 RepID=UPI003B27D287
MARWDLLGKEVPNPEYDWRDIFLTQDIRDTQSGKDVICQIYIPKPFTLDGFKFNLRLYVLVTSCDPLRIYLYNEGLVCFATKKYSEPTEKNLDDVCMHLTNYAINKRIMNFVPDEKKGSKRKLSFFNQYMESNAYDLEVLWSSIEDVIIKTILSVYPALRNTSFTCFPNHVSGSACFQLLGFDILLDHTLKPWLMKVKHSLSSVMDSNLDQEVKEDLLYDTLCMINLAACGRQKDMEEERPRKKEQLPKIWWSREYRADETRNNQATWVEQVEKYEDEKWGTSKGSTRAPLQRNTRSSWEQLTPRLGKNMSGSCAGKFSRVRSRRKCSSKNGGSLKRTCKKSPSCRRIQPC